MESLLPTDRLIDDADRAIRNLSLGNGYRQELLGIRNQLRTRTEELMTRLENGDQWFLDNPNDRSFTRQVDHWIALLKEYEASYDATQRAEAAMSGTGHE